MRIDNKGFIASGILYTLLLLFLVLIISLISMFSSRKLILDRLKDNILNSTYKKYNNGEIVYFNPTTGFKCSLEDYNKNVDASGNVIASKTGTKEGCMKWYVFNDNAKEANVNLILDHNTTSFVEWISRDDYINEGGSSTEYGNNKGYVTVSNKLQTDTEQWIDGLAPRLIKADEVAKITLNVNWKSSLTTSKNFYFDSKKNEQSSTCNGENNTNCKYGWLYDNTLNCKKYGCNNEVNDTNGYWTTSRDISSTDKAWVVNNDSSLNSYSVSINNKYGVRPVISIEKSKIYEKEEIE